MQGLPDRPNVDPSRSTTIERSGCPRARWHASPNIRVLVAQHGPFGQALTSVVRWDDAHSIPGNDDRGIWVVEHERMRTWRPTAAGVLSIMTGAFICQFQLGKAIRAESLTWPRAIGTVLTVGLGLVALLGGVSAVKHKAWRLALAGAICALFPAHAYGYLIWTPLLGVLAVAFVVTSRNEFADAGGRSVPRIAADAMRRSGDRRHH